MLTSLVLPAKGEVNVASWSVRVERKHTSKNCQNEISGRNDPQDFPHWWPNSPNVTKNMSCQSSGTKLAICLKSVQSIQWDILCTQMQFPIPQCFIGIRLIQSHSLMELNILNRRALRKKGRAAHVQYRASASCLSSRF